MDSLSQNFFGDPPERPTLLIADDDPVVRSMLSMSLDQQFQIVAAVEDSAKAIASTREHHPDAALIDVDMPAGGGASAVKGIVEVSPGTAIVVLSADESDTLVRELLQAGAVTYRRKGIDPQELASTLENAIQAMRQASGAIAAGQSDH